jgi:type II secretory pathway pseudopilin PulG
MISPAPVRRRRRGFTFYELLAAVVFVGLVIPVAMRGLAVANRAGVMAERKRVAVQLADRLLTDMIVTGDWRRSSRTGDFGDEWPNFRWQIDSEAWDEDTLEVVRVHVFFQVQGREFSVTLCTLDEEAEE